MIFLSFSYAILNAPKIPKTGGMHMKDENKLVITIGRQFGSGGCEVGTKLAQELGLDFYDKTFSA